MNMLDIFLSGSVPDPFSRRDGFLRAGVQTFAALFYSDTSQGHPAQL